MSQAKATSHAQLLALREEFDRDFTQAPSPENGSIEKLLSIRVGAGSYAMRVADIGGLYVDRRIVPLPSPVGALLGMAGFRGQIAAVYDLAVLLGYVRQTPPRWLVLLREREPVALAFDAFDAHLAVRSEHIFLADQVAAVAPAAARPHLNDAVRTEHALLSIINLTSLLKNIRDQNIRR
ncbi:chemotaxis signal transduction protein [Herbaspirillum sp. CF444]|uniref:chemotaxis protein CheW n=1 Tax=Herbaspirillum sp. CF444 TaxID=1144319 RepID=UPI00027283B4|nr:chemotaxis protein CheW [Herbaspirillum sp. CF444]EJL90872.1 chemotaxis signal transduction protein [Herbaspirillum sp. CF444]